MVRNDVVRKVIAQIDSLSRIDKFQIGQPLIEADFINAIYMPRNNNCQNITKFFF